jgi:hypothetical protein
MPSGDFIRLIEAVRLLARARDPTDPWLTGILFPDWYGETSVAKRAAEILCYGVQRRHVRLRGELDRQMGDIDPVWNGKLDVLNGTYLDGDANRVYREVSCDKGDVEEIISYLREGGNWDGPLLFFRKRFQKLDVIAVRQRLAEFDKWAEAKNDAFYPTDPARPPTVEQDSAPDEIKATKSTSQKSNAGRARVHDRDEAIGFAKQLWEENGDPRQVQNAKKDWRSDYDIAEWVVEHLRKHDKEQEPPEVSTVSKWLRPVLSELRARQA